MDTDSARLVASLLGVVVGMVVLLYGVALDAGQSLNALMVVGGVIGLVSMGAMALDTVRQSPADH